MGGNFFTQDQFPPEIEVQMDMSESPNVKWTYTINGVRRVWGIGTLFPLFPPKTRKGHFLYFIGFFILRPVPIRNWSSDPYDWVT